jgi:hypothetical protein
MKGSNTKTQINVVNTCKVNGNGQQTARSRGQPQIKFVDVSQVVNVSSTGTVLSGLTAITQGVGVSQRTGDTIFMKSFFMNYAINAANSDIFTTARVVIFQWIPNSSIAVPLYSDIFQTPDIYAMYDWQFANQYRILYDKIHFLSGTGTNPTTASNQGFFGELNISTLNRKVEFSQASAFGSNELYCLVISDSAIIPFPLLNIRTRITYSEE